MILMFPKLAVLVVGACWLIGCKQDVVVQPCKEERAAEEAQLKSVESASPVVEMKDKALPEAWVRSTRVLGREGVIIPQVPTEENILDFEMAISDIAKQLNPEQENRWVESFYRQYKLLRPGVMEVVLLCKKPEGFGVDDFSGNFYAIYDCYCTARFDLKTKKGTVAGCWEPVLPKNPQ